MINIPIPPYTAEDRRSLLDQVTHLQAELTSLRQQIEAEGETPELIAAEDQLVDTLLTTRQMYAARTPIVPLSRCPYTGLEVHYPIDTFGLDGLWWDYDDPVRPKRKLPPTVFALTGAIAPSDSVEFTPNIVSPGPSSPYVIPRLLAEDGTTAVLSSLKIGPHQAYAIVYFGFPAQPERPVVNEWGRQDWLIQMADPPGWDAMPLLIKDCDFDLRPWIEGERLLWIAPEDEQLTLHLGVNECPYMDLDGRRELLHIFQGRRS
jgi:hypothetical protein